jgi:hypothetical protein
LALPLETYQAFANSACPQLNLCDSFVAVAEPGGIPGFASSSVTATLSAAAAVGLDDALPQNFDDLALYESGDFILQAFREHNPPGFSHVLIGTLALQPAAPVPEPGTLVLIGTGSAGLLARFLRRRRSRRSATTAAPGKD